MAATSLMIRYFSAVCILLLHIIPISRGVVPGSRLLDFPHPDFRRTLIYPDDFYGRSYAEVVHGFGSVPFHVRVYVMPKDGNNANFAFEGTGGCQVSLKNRLSSRESRVS